MAKQTKRVCISAFSHPSEGRQFRQLGADDLMYGHPMETDDEVDIFPQERKVAVLFYQ